MYTLRNTKTGKYLNKNEIPRYYESGNFVFRILSIRQQTDKCIGDFFDDEVYYFADIDQLNNHVNFVLMAIARVYSSTVDRVFDEFTKDCEIVDYTGDVFSVEGKILCGKMRGRVDY